LLFLAGSRRRALRTPAGLAEAVHHAAFGLLRASTEGFRASHAARRGGSSL